MSRLDRFEYSAMTDWDPQQLQVHFALVRQADGSYLADVLSQGRPLRENVRVSDEVVSDILAAVERFRSIPDQPFGGPGIDQTYTVLAEGKRADGSKVNLGRALFEPTGGEPRRQVRELKATVEAIVASLSAGPVGGGGPVTGLIHSVPGH